MSIAVKLTAVAQNQQKVYDAGYTAGQEAGGYGQGYADGQQAEHDTFWDIYQQNGERTNYSYAFSGAGWTEETFRPKYDLNMVNNAASMFESSAIPTIPVAVDFSQCTNIYMCFRYSKLVKLPRLDLSKVVTSNFAFGYCYDLEEIACLVFSEGTVLTTNAFYQSTALKTLTVEGTINTVLSFAHSAALSDDSVQSIIDHLKDLNDSTTQTLIFHAAVGGKLTDDQKAEITAKNWTLAY